VRAAVSSMSRESVQEMSAEAGGRRRHGGGGRRRDGRGTRVTGVRALVALAGSATLLAGCATSSGGAAETTSPGSLRIFAAASLQETFTEIGQEFTLAHPGVDVALSFGGSADLVTQLVEGAPADVVATADATTMDRLTDEGLVEASTPFATNSPAVVVPASNPAGVTSFADLARPDVTVVVCAPQVPCGALTDQLETATGVTLSPASEESSVTDVLTKVVTGEADAGVVYVTDALRTGADVEVIEVPEAGTIVTTYSIAALTDAAQPSWADEFVDLVTGTHGQQLFADAGFAPPG
jgi:molybdate transport system substrate-binding protein